MLLFSLFSLLAAGLTTLTYALAAPSLWWLLPLWLGFFVAVGLVYVVALLTTLICMPQAVPTPGRRRFYHFLIVHTLRFVLALLGVRYTLEGAERLPSGGPFLLVENHRSGFDPLVTLAALKGGYFCFVCKPEVLRIPVIGTAMRRVGFFPIDRENARHAVAAIRHGAALVADAGLSVGVYPEGTRSKSGALLPFHAGPFKIAALAKCPVAVVAVRMTRRRGRAPAFTLTVVDTMAADFVATAKADALCAHAEDSLRHALEP